MDETADTIAALATPVGRGGIGVVRLSGPRVPAITRRLTGSLPAPRTATLCRFCDPTGTAIDQGIALYFPAPHSYTGEHVVELHGHGGPIVMDLLLAAATAAGARLARPGEFSERAFLNGKLDLAQAEAIADLIDSGTSAAARSALRSLRGEFSTRIKALADKLLALRLFIEAAIDFPDEQIDLLVDRDIDQQLRRIIEQTDTLLASSRQASLLREGLNVVLAGPPNAGKSSVLNALAREQRAIVSDIPGTTRDLIEQRLQIDGLIINLIDTAGLRDPVDAVETEGVRRAHGAIAGADRVLLIIDDETATDSAVLLAQLPVVAAVSVVHNKVDLSGRTPGLDRNTDPPNVAVSARTGAGLDALRQHLKSIAGFGAEVEAPFLARRRHLDAIMRARACLRTAAHNIDRGDVAELVAEDLRLAYDALGEITGRITSDDLLGQIFSSFCIGK